MKTNNLSVTIIGCGWLGMPLAQLLIEQKNTVFGSVRNSERIEELRLVGIEPFIIDLEKSTEIPTEIAKSTSTLIITLPPIDRKNPARYARILEDLLRQFSDDTHVVFTSSTGIYPEETGNFEESFQFSSEQESTVLHRAEDAIRGSGKAHTIFRLGGLIGPKRHPIRFLQGRRRLKNPKGSINFVHQGDCLRAIMQAIDDRQLIGTFNLVFPSHPSRETYYDDAAKHYGFQAPEFEANEKIDRIISSEKVQADFNFQFEFRIDCFPEL